LNQITLIGRLTADPAKRSPRDDLTVTEFGLAVNTRFGKGKERVDFFECVAWSGLAAVIADRTTKGTRLAVSGRVQHDRWQAEDGSRRSKHVVVVESIEFLDGRPSPQATADEAA
jgi:single-strand DNA-binding protein